MSTKYFDYIVNKISAAKLQANSLAAGIRHRGVEGQIREIAIRDCITPFLTQSYQCSSGKIIDSLQNISDQIDLIIYHKKIVPPILINHDLGLFPVECVRYAFEIKTKLTASEIKDANKKFTSVRNLISFPNKQADGSIQRGSLPTTVLFAFDSDLSGSEIDRYLKHSKESPPACIVLCVLGKGYWFYNGGTKHWYGEQVTTASQPYQEFCMFIGGLMNTLSREEASSRPFDPASYIYAEDIILKPHLREDSNNL